MPQPQVDLNSAGVRALLTSEGVSAEIRRQAEEVARRARSRGVRVEGEPGDIPVPVTVVDAGGRTRARWLVVLDHPSGEAVESQHRLLGGALG